MSIQWTQTCIALRRIPRRLSTRNTSAMAAARVYWDMEMQETRDYAMAEKVAIAAFTREVAEQKRQFDAAGGWKKAIV